LKLVELVDEWIGKREEEGARGSNVDVLHEVGIERRDSGRDGKSKV